MKLLITFIAAISITGACLGQVTEVKSGIIQMNITRKAADTKKAADEQRALAEYSLHAARNFALIIANESYDDPAISDLGQPVKDATELYNTEMPDKSAFQNRENG